MNLINKFFKNIYGIALTLIDFFFLLLEIESKFIGYIYFFDNMITCYIEEFMRKLYQSTIS